MIRLKAEVFGKVQGVFYRVWTKRKADSLGLTGFVKNLPTGSVLVVAEGEKEKLKEFLDFLWEGSPSAKVREVKASWEKATKEFSSFEIR